MALEEIFGQLKIWMMNLWLKSYTFCLYLKLYLHNTGGGGNPQQKYTGILNKYELLLVPPQGDRTQYSCDKWAEFRLGKGTLDTAPFRSPSPWQKELLLELSRNSSFILSRKWTYVRTILLNLVLRKKS